MCISIKAGVVLWTAAVLGLFAFESAGAQERSGALQEAIALIVEEGEWERGAAALEQLLEGGGLSQSERSEARKFLAVAYLQLGQKEKTVEVFKEIVRDDPAFDMEDLSLDGIAEPPAEMVRYFGQAILEVRQEELRAYEARLRRTSGAVALLRSAIVPGWGQRYLGYSNRGYIMAGMTVASIAYAVAAERAYRGARDDYTSAPRGSDFDGLYDDYERKSGRADLALGIVAAVWALNMVDAATQRPNIAEPPQGLTLKMPDTHDGVYVAYYVRF